MQNRSVWFPKSLASGQELANGAGLSRSVVQTVPAVVEAKQGDLGLDPKRTSDKNFDNFLPCEDIAGKEKLDHNSFISGAAFLANVLECFLSANM